MQLKDEWNSLLENEEKICIYGAGKYGRLIWKLLKNSNKEKNVLGFIVSDLNNNPAIIEDKLVYEVNNVDNMGGTGINCSI